MTTPLLAASNGCLISESQKGAKSAKAPKKGYLNGVGLSRPQSYRATIPESWKGRFAPRRTANIAKEIRRAIRRGHPSGAMEIINNKSNLRYLTASEEAHLRGSLHTLILFLASMTKPWGSSTGDCQRHQTSVYGLLGRRSCLMACRAI